jgi:hypothetical protein
MFPRGSRNSNNDTQTDRQTHYYGYQEEAHNREHDTAGTMMITIRTPPILPPRIPGDPEFLSRLVIPAPSGQHHRVGVFPGGCDVVVDPPHVVVEAVTVQRRRDRTPSEDLRLDRRDEGGSAVSLFVLVLPVLGHGRVRDEIDLGARPAVLHEGVARPAGVEGGARRVDVRADPPPRRIEAAREVGLARLVRDESSTHNRGHAPRREEHVRLEDAPPVAGSHPPSWAAIQHVLDGQVDLVAQTAPCDLDPIRQRGEGGVGPAASAVLG